MWFGYSLALAPVNSVDPRYNFYGDASRFWLSGLGLNTAHENAPTIPESVYCTYMLTFAIITPALICGSFADRMKFPSMLLFIGLWHLLVYCPVAHSMWHPSGFLYAYGVLDYAGGNVVHITSGISGLACAVYLGHRKGYGKEAFEPHNILLSAVGSSMLWIGWFGFNAGSAVAANNRAGMAILVTQIASATATISWMFTEWLHVKQPRVQGLVSGAIAGLVSVTPASGYIDQTGAFFIGLVAGPLCYGGIQLKHYLGYDDALDGFGVHGIGGIIGGIGKPLPRFFLLSFTFLSHFCRCWILCNIWS
jgi:Amt family ammonium transporter